MSTAGFGTPQAQPSDDVAKPILEALEISLDSTTPAEKRKEALDFLEKQKEENAIPNGYLLASNPQNSALTRHFGLGLLEHALKHDSLYFSYPEVDEVRNILVNLANAIAPTDPSFIRNKVVLLWVEMAKRFWGRDWMTLDEELTRIWNMNDPVHKEFVLLVLETLSEDVIHHEDTISSLRGNELNRALVEICTPLQILKGSFADRHDRNGNRTDPELRCGTEGWLFRASVFLYECLQNLNGSPEIKNCALRALELLKSLVVWAIPQTFATCGCVETITMAMMAPDGNLLLAAVETLHALYGRANMTIGEFRDLVSFIFRPDTIDGLRKLFIASAEIDPNDIDDTKYIISKRFSELVAYLSRFVEEEDFEIKNEADIIPFFTFMTSIVEHQSLTISIPVLHSWSRLLELPKIINLNAINDFIAPLLEICTMRLLRYDSFSEDSPDPSVIFLHEDIDTVPEMHAFVSNYRRFCSHIIEIITQKRPAAAIAFIFPRVDYVLDNLYTGLPPFHPSHYEKWSVPLLKADTQFNVVEATLKGFRKWSISDEAGSDAQRAPLEDSLEAWAASLLQRQFTDPALKNRVLRLSVDFSKAFDRPNFSFKVLEHILTIMIPDAPEYPLYSDAVKDLHALATYSARRLAFRQADNFSTWYDVIEQKVREIAATSETDGKGALDFSPVLLIILQRATNIDPAVREERLRYFSAPIRASWQDEQFKHSVATFPGFCEMFGLDRVWRYLETRGVSQISDWTTVPLDEEGQKLRDEINLTFSKYSLRATKTMLTVSTDKMSTSGQAYDVAFSLWHDMIPVMLPTVLNLIGNVHAFQNPDSFPGITPPMRDVLRRVLNARFWQAGISSGSRDEFYSRVATSKATLEGFSSSVRGIVRAVREACYSILYCMSRFKEQFYSIEGLAPPLSQALFKDASHLQSHQFSVLLGMVRHLIVDCPQRYWPVFMSPMIASLFTEADRKATTEWQKIEQLREGMIASDLTEEMKEESLLRDLTHSAVTMVANLIGRSDRPTHVHAPPEGTASGLTPSPGDPQTSIRDFVLSSPQTLEPVVLFCTHALQMKDTRSCGIIIRVLRSIVPEFTHQPDTPTQASIREFISTEVLKACITSVHEPYFVDIQKDLAQLIASIWLSYLPYTQTPQSVFLSLPGMTQEKVLASQESLVNTSSSRQQKAIILDILEGLRGVTISEQGQFMRPQERRKARTAMQTRYMTIETDEKNNQGSGGIKDEPDLTGLGEMFGE